MTSVQSFQHRCQQCNNSLILSRGSFVCDTCGAVDGPEYKQPSFFTLSHSLGDRPNIVDGIGSFIGSYRSTRFIDCKGIPIMPSSQVLYKRLKWSYNLKFKSSNFETHFRCLRRLNIACSILNLPLVINYRAAYLYKKIVKAEDSGELPKLSNHPLLAALCLFAAIREAGPLAPYNINEVVNAFGSNRRTSRKNMIRLAAQLAPAFNIVLKRRKCSDYFPRIIDEVFSDQAVQIFFTKSSIGKDQFRQQLTKFSNRIFAFTEKQPRYGLNPYALASSIVYYAGRLICNLLSGESKCYRKIFISQKDMARITGICEFTIRDQGKKYLKSITRKLQEDLTHGQ
ncbi:MAG: hypothetical protein HZR80_20865 [Candidatus Heimdallarchaeota archaeon]